MNYGNLTVIGTSHIARQSIQEIKDFIEEQKPEIVALELDHNRYHALTTKTKQSTSIFVIGRIGLLGFLFSVLGGWAQKALGKMVGVTPGSEMLAAIKLAKKHKLHITLIDQDIELTLKRLSKIPAREKSRIFFDIIKGIFTRKDELKELGVQSIDLSKVPERQLIKRIMGILRERYPNIHRVLVEERNVAMAKNLACIMRSNPNQKILAVVGAGHDEEILKLVKLYHNAQEFSFSVTV